jgi:hypothetical protein
MQILEERRNKNRGRKEAKRLLGLAQLRLANALSSATVEDVMDDCALLLVHLFQCHKWARRCVLRCMCYFCDRRHYSLQCVDIRTLS